MDIRQSIHSAHARTLDTAGLRREFLVPEVFRPGEMTMTYSHIDRIVLGGIVPLAEPIGLPEDIGKTFGVAYFLERRELGIINLGGPAAVRVDEKTYDVAHEEALYVGMGTRVLGFASRDPSHPAKLYYVSAPAHRSLPNKLVTFEDAVHVRLGDAANANRRTINKYFVPEVVETCQLCMGMTRLEEGSLWNTMPSHTHERRMEAYLYFDMPADAVVFHLMGEPQETRHIVVQNEQVVISPSWSIHSGVGTRAYTFIWAMLGENQTFDDMDNIRTQDLR